MNKENEELTSFQKALLFIDHIACDNYGSFIRMMSLEKFKDSQDDCSKIYDQLYGSRKYTRSFIASLEVFVTQIYDFADFESTEEEVENCIGDMAADFQNFLDYLKSLVKSPFDGDLEKIVLLDVAESIERKKICYSYSSTYIDEMQHCSGNLRETLISYQQSKTPTRNYKRY